MHRQDDRSGATSGHHFGTRSGSRSGTTSGTSPPSAGAILGMRHFGVARALTLLCRCLEAALRNGGSRWEISHKIYGCMPEGGGIAFVFRSRLPFGDSRSVPQRDFFGFYPIVSVRSSLTLLFPPCCAAFSRAIPSGHNRDARPGTGDGGEGLAPELERHPRLNGQET